MDPGDHIGHEAELDDLLRSTAAVGALAYGDRRMGKTSLLAKAAERLGEHVVLRISAETDDPELFGSRLLDILRGNPVFRDELARWHVRVDVGYRGVRLQREPVSGQAAPPESDDLFAWAAARAAPAKLIVVVDEITVLAMALERKEPGAALEFLRSFRRPRQELDNVAVVLAGSLGIHHAVPSSEPVNDLVKIHVGPLEPEDAAFLARCLILGENLNVSDELDVAYAMADATDGIPYFIHHLAAAARRRGGILNPDVVTQLRDAALVDPDDPWNLRHYRDRLDDYYGDDSPLARNILDAFARADADVDVDRLIILLGATEVERRPDRDQLVQLIESLEADHYLVRRGDANAFSSRILRDAWRRMRRL